MTMTDTVPRTSSSTDSADRSVPELISHASQEVTQLIRDELRLAQAEMAAKGRRLGMGGGLFGAAGLTAIIALQALAAAAIAGLAVALSVWLSALIVAAGLSVLAAALSLVAKQQVAKADPLMPEQAIAGVKADVAEIKKDAHR